MYLCLKNMSKTKTLREYYYMQATGEYLPHDEIGKLVMKNVEKMIDEKETIQNR